MPFRYCLLTSEPGLHFQVTTAFHQTRFRLIPTDSPPNKRSQRPVWFISILSSIWRCVCVTKIKIMKCVMTPVSHTSSPTSVNSLFLSYNVCDFKCLRWQPVDMWVQWRKISLISWTLFCLGILWQEHLFVVGLHVGLNVVKLVTLRTHT